MIKFLFCFLLFVLLNCCPKQQVIYYPRDTHITADTIQTFLVEPYWWMIFNDSTYKLIKVDYWDSDTIVKPILWIFEYNQINSIKQGE